MKVSPSAGRVALALALGSAASSGLTVLALAIFNLSSASAYSADAPLAYLAWFGLTFAAALTVASTIGLLWHAFCRHRGWKGPHAYWTAGALVGALPGVVWLSPVIATAFSMFVILYGATLGGLTGLFAWLIRRPDREAANPPTSQP